MCGKQRSYKSFVFVSAVNKGLTGGISASAATKGLSANRLSIHMVIYHTRHAKASEKTTFGDLSAERTWGPVAMRNGGSHVSRSRRVRTRLSEGKAYPAPWLRTAVLRIKESGRTHGTFGETMSVVLRELRKRSGERAGDFMERGSDHGGLAAAIVLVVFDDARSAPRWHSKTY